MKNDHDGARFLGVPPKGRLAALSAALALSVMIPAVAMAETPRPSLDVPRASVDKPRPAQDTGRPSVEVPRVSAETPRPVAAGAVRAATVAAPKAAVKTGDAPRASVDVPRPVQDTGRPSTEAPRASVEAPRPVAAGAARAAVAASVKVAADAPRTSTEVPRPSTEVPRPSPEIPKPAPTPTPTPTPVPSPQGAAFPGAIGYGAQADGWRGGQVIAVTSLADSGAGTLRACAEARDPRVCVFQVSGTITLNTPLMVKSNVYIAGQTAPGGGIQLKMQGSTHGPMVVKNADDVVVRFLKLRPGVSVKSANVDALTIENARNVYVGNVSMAFASDETLNIHVAGNTVSDITVADSILAYSLDKSNHPQGSHSKGALICSDEKKNNQCGRITLARNLFAHHRDRNPDVKGTPIGPVEVVNNIFYNPFSQFGEFYDLLGDAKIAYVGNLALGGRSTNVSRAKTAVEAIDAPGGFTLGIYEEGNLAFSQSPCGSRKPMPILDAPAAAVRIAPFALAVRPIQAGQLESVLPGRVGDALHRDALDQRVLSDLANCQGRMINSPDEVGGWPVIAASPAPVDTDRDLLPDSFELSQGMNPAVADNPWSDHDRNGVPAIETWLAVAAGDR